MPDNNTIAFKINLLSTNCDKFETFVNGTEAETVLLGGVATHTLRYFSQHLTAVNNAAAASADAAEASNQAAHTSEIAAKGSENAAKLSETNAAASAASAAASAGDVDAAVDLAQQAVLDAQAAANNINIRKYPQSGYVYALPGQTVITPNFTMDTVKDNVAIYLDGIKQGRGGYTFTATDITLSEALAGGETIEVISANADAGSVTPTYTELPVGTPFPHFAALGYVPAGCVPMDGAEYTRAQFPVLYDTYLAGGKLQTCTYAVWATQVGLTGNCGMFALDTVNQKFKVPLLKDGDSITQAASAAELGKSVKAGLPNVTGTFGGYSGATLGMPIDVSKMSGCCYASQIYGADEGRSGNNVALTGSGKVVTIDASRSKAIYRNDVTTVLDEQIRLRWFVVMANAQNNTSVFDWSNYMAGLAGKANNDLDNISAAGQTKIKDTALKITTPLGVMSAAGTWTITGCRAGVPMLIMLQGSTSANDLGGAQIRPVSGVLNGDLNGMALGLVSGSTRPNFHVLIPSADTVVLSVYNITTSPTCYLRAYQQGA